ncbi:enolase-phosphatase E1 [Lepisosteus oculatus]|uniref:enolase-phosphatase E1 n=1 Tax=Lepisosteus oculatus TaxID=7918 RepID=UPI0035F50DBC
MGGKLSKKKKGYDVSDPKSNKKNETAEGQVEQDEVPESKTETEGQAASAEQPADTSTLDVSKETLEEKSKMEPKVEEEQAVQRQEMGQEGEAKTENGCTEPAKETAAAELQDRVAQVTMTEEKEKEKEPINEEAKTDQTQEMGQADNTKETENRAAQPTEETASESKETVPESAKKEENSEKEKESDETINQEAQESPYANGMKIEQQAPVEERDPLSPNPVLDSQCMEISPMEKSKDMPVTEEEKITPKLQETVVPVLDANLENKEASQEVGKCSGEETGKTESASPLTGVTPESSSVASEETSNAKTSLENTDIHKTEPITKASAEEEKNILPAAPKTADRSSYPKAQSELPNMQKEINTQSQETVVKSEDVILEEMASKSEAANEESHSVLSHTSVPILDPVQEPVPTAEDENKTEDGKPTEVEALSSLNENPSVKEISEEIFQQQSESTDDKESSATKNESITENAQDATPEVTNSAHFTCIDSTEAQTGAEKKSETGKSEVPDAEHKKTMCESQEVENNELNSSLHAGKDTAFAQAEPQNQDTVCAILNEQPKENTTPALKTETIPEIIISESHSNNEFPEDETLEYAIESEKAVNSHADGVSEMHEKESSTPSPAESEAVKEMTSETEIGLTTANQEVNAKDACANSNKSVQAVDTEVQNEEGKKDISTESAEQPKEKLVESAELPEQVQQNQQQNGPPEIPPAEQATEMSAKPQHEECVNSINKEEESPKEPNPRNGGELKKNLNLTDDEEASEPSSEIPDALSTAAGNEIELA